MDQRRPLWKVVSASSLGLVCAALMVIPGCQASTSNETIENEVDLLHYDHSATQIEYPNVATPIDYDAVLTPAPFAIEEPREIDYIDLTLDEAMRTALMNSPVLRDLGGLVLQSPSSVSTVHDPAIQETDPVFGVAGALSAFDTSFAHSSFVEYNDRQLNNTFFGGGTRALKQDLSTHQTQLSKTAATGTEMILANNTDYDANNAPGNQFPSAWNTNIEVEMRHPLLYGGGVDFNRIAGPGGTPGSINGLVIARLNTDSSLAEFEISVRDFVSNVENAYWDLYFAYRDLDAKVRARDVALQTWNRVNALFKTGRLGGSEEEEAQARAQYYFFQEQVQNALTGRPQEGTRNRNGSTGGTFRATPGVHLAERRLRLMMGELPNGDQLYRPADEPILAEVAFDWDECLIESLTRRAELRLQKWAVLRREKELVANRNFLLPNMDVIGRYRWRGFGRDLIRQGSNLQGNALDDLTGGDFTEWQLGVEFSVPLGRRQGHAAVRNAELNLVRARSILREQERQVVNDISGAITEQKRAYAVLKTNYNRYLASKKEYQVVKHRWDSELEQDFNLVLDAQRRAVEAESTYYRALIDYALAIKNVHFEKGSLLNFNEVYLTEGLWPMKAYYDASEKRNLKVGRLPWWIRRQLPPQTTVSQGVFPQLMTPYADEGAAIYSEEQAAPVIDEELPPEPDEVDQATDSVESELLLDSEPSRVELEPRAMQPLPAAVLRAPAAVQPKLAAEPPQPAAAVRRAAAELLPSDDELVPVEFYSEESSRISDEEKAAFQADDPLAPPPPIDPKSGKEWWDQ